jgi:hypothetical protein
VIFHPEVFKIAFHLEGQRGSARKVFERARQELTFHQFDDAGRGGDAGNMPVKASAVAQPGWGDDLRVARVSQSLCEPGRKLAGILRFEDSGTFGVWTGTLLILCGSGNKV